MNIDSIKSRIKTLSDAYEAKGLQRDQIVFDSPATGVQLSANSFIDAAILTDAINEGWKPDFNDPAQERFSIQWEMRSVDAGGPGFCIHTVNQDNYHLATVSAHLVFRSREGASYAATEFPEVYRPFMTLPESLF
jgi:hypothetical protein